MSNEAGKLKVPFAFKGLEWEPVELPGKGERAMFNQVEIGGFAVSKIRKGVTLHAWFGSAIFEGAPESPEQAKQWVEAALLEWLRAASWAYPVRRVTAAEYKEATATQEGGK